MTESTPPNRKPLDVRTLTFIKQAIMKTFSTQNAKEIGDSLGINWNEVNLDEFTKGLNVELEHGTKFPETNVTDNDTTITGKIAWAHLKEFPDYYTRLEKLENEANEYWKAKGRAGQ
jgi:hypothetical protein